MTSTVEKFDKRHLPFGNVTAIKDPDVVNLLKSVTYDFNDNVHLDFLSNFQQWILNGKNNLVKGLDLFKYSCFSNGTTEAFEKFYSKHSSRRLRFFKGEYTYHRLFCRNFNISWMFIEDDLLDSNDAVIISLPFSNTGNSHQSMAAVLDECTRLKIPVLIDCVYYGTCSNIDFDLTHDCITDVAFGLSKTFPVANLRIGMRLTKIDDDDPLFVLNKIGYVNKLSAHIGNLLISNFSADYVFNKYSANQDLYCKELQVEKSNTVLFGLSTSDLWKDYDRGVDIKRLSFHNFFHRNFDHFLKSAYESR